MKSLTKKQKLWFTVFLLVDILLAYWAISEIVFPHWIHSYGVFRPEGIIADQQKGVIITAVLIMLAGALPVLTAGFYVAFKYREGNDQEYQAEGLNPRLQVAGWVFVGLIILCVSILNFKSGRELDPAKAITSATKPLTIQVVALNWKWLFIYPDQNIATINYIDIPEKTPVHFQLTADNAPMNLFWVPQLGGQMAAMAGMVNNLNLEADHTGQFQGLASDINGEGFAGMKFTVNSLSQNDFKAWAATVKASHDALTADEYNQLTAPSKNNPPTSYSSVAANLYGNIIIKYMAPASSTSTKMQM